MKKNTLIFTFFLLIPFIASANNNPMDFINKLIQDEIKNQKRQFKIAHEPQPEDEYMEYPEISFKAQLKFLTSMLNSKDIELKKNYFLAEFVSLSEFEKSTLETMGSMMEPHEKKKVADTIKSLESKIETLKTF